MKHLPSIFSGSFEDSLRTVYCGSVEKPVPFFSAANIEAMLGVKNPYGSATSRVNTVISRIEEYLADNPDTPHKAPHTPVVLLGSSKPAEIVSDDGTYTILGVKSSSRATARQSYYYNEAAVYYVLNTAKTDVANNIQHWINGSVLPTIAKYGEYIGVRKDGIGLRRGLTDAIKRLIDLKRATEMAYPTVTDVVYIIRYGMNSNQLRRHLGLEEGDNIREHLSQEELQALAKIENDLTGALNLGLSLEQVMGNKDFIAIHRKPL